MSRLLGDLSFRHLPSASAEPEKGFRYMKRRRIDRRDRAGHPLGGAALILPLAAAFAVGLMVAALAGLGILDLLVADTFTLVANPGEPNMRVIMKRDGKIQQLGMQDVPPVQGVGTLVGSFYKLADGSIMWVADLGVVPTPPDVPPVLPGPITPASPSTPTSVAPTPTPSASPTPTTTPTPVSPLSPTPTPTTPARTPTLKPLPPAAPLR